LQINASARSEGGNSTRLANSITAHLKSHHPEAEVEVRDLARNPLPFLDEAGVTALFTPADQRTPEQIARIALDEAMIARVQAADVLVLGVPMYNFGVSVQLKSFIDSIARAGITFRYTESGPEGLLKGKRVYVACARGGVYRDTPADSQTPYLRQVLGFLGMTDVEFIYAEGMNLGPESAEKSFAAAEAAIANLPV
ncbi:MAG TPA: NAD(P)H-dependent oxidoreductase, partial [Chromatiaceae bacterium]|nr:NAD(P)H-dependent oxidoreductase [Chromatiaceae bacterium]